MTRSKLDVLESLFISGQYPNFDIPSDSNIVPETIIGQFFWIIKQYEKNGPTIIEYCNEIGEMETDVDENYYLLLDNLYALFFVNLWSKVEIFLVNIIELYNRLEERKIRKKWWHRLFPKQPYKKEVQHNYRCLKRWFKNHDIPLQNIQFESSANQVRELCNHFKHHGNLEKIFPANKDPFKTEKYINKGIQKIDVNWVKKHQKGDLNHNPDYYDLDLEKIMQEVGEFCNEVRKNTIMQYKKVEHLK